MTSYQNNAASESRKNLREHPDSTRLTSFIPSSREKRHPNLKANRTAQAAFFGEEKLT